MVRGFFMPCFISKIVKMNRFRQAGNLMHHVVPCHSRTRPLITCQLVSTRSAHSSAQIFHSLTQCEHNFHSESTNSE